MMGNQHQELAIFVRDLGQQSQFYTMSGQWVQRMNSHPTFYVPGFVGQQELDEIIPFLPKSDVSGDKLNRLNTFEQILPRDIGRPAIRKMLAFWTKADEAFVKMAPKIELAHQTLAHPFRTTYATLDEIAAKILGSNIPKLPGGKYPKTVLYAVHRRLLSNDIGVYTQQKGTLRAGGEYGIVSRNEVHETRSVTHFVRTYVTEKAKGAPPLRRGPLEGFTVKCQRLIDNSRKHRQFTPHGMVGPSSEKSTGVQYREGCVQEKFTPIENLFVRFIESWVGLQSFNRGASTLNSVGSHILRAVGRYEDVKMDVKTGWTFLQEIGVIPPWETRAPYVLRLPQTGQRLQTEASVPGRGFVEDKLTDIRKDWGDLPAFCIDAPDAHEIDDAISIEKTDNEDEHWLHIHVADPASHMDVKGAAADFAQRMTSTTYLPDRSLGMLDSEIVQSKFSLAGGRKRPCLTFSAKLDADGKILEYKVSAGILNNVFNLTPEVLGEISLGKETSTGDTMIHTVGESPPTPSAPSRSMSSVADLNDHHESLKLLSHFGQLRLRLLRSQGGMYFGPNKFSIAVDFRGPKWAQSLPGHSCSHAGDPTIQVASKGVGRSRNGTFSYLMHLASEVCAKWCNERGIPTIYRVTPRNGSAESAPDYFKRVLAPIIKEGKEIPVGCELEYQTLTGPAQPSTTPGPHITVGAEMLTKCTSPLRRYSDLLVHWQLGAALSEEHRMGHSLIGNKKEAIFPFTNAQIDELLPRIDTRERLIKKVSRDADMAWFMQFIFRSWKFKESELPPMTFMVKDVRNPDKFGETAFGLVTQFAAPAQMTIPDWLDAKDVKASDVFEVEIADVDVVEGTLTVEPTRRVESLSEK